MVPLIRFTHKGDFSKLSGFLEKAKESIRLGTLNKYGRLGVKALSAATPVDSGTTAASWSYQIERGDGTESIIFLNSNVNRSVNIAIILQYGHGTGTGGWVQGRDYINPALRPVFDKLADEVWEEVISYG